MMKNNRCSDQTHRTVLHEMNRMSYKIVFLLLILFLLTLFLFSCNTVQPEEIEWTYVKETKEDAVIVQGLEDESAQTLYALEVIESTASYFAEALLAKGENELNEAVNEMEKAMLEMRSLKVSKMLEEFRSLYLEKGRLIQKYLRASLREDQSSADKTKKEILDLEKAVEAESLRIRAELGLME
jgi:hypothetical protein